ncbi:MAG: DUF6745 domain-containing protein [Geminicoccaceae bacterium]
MATARSEFHFLPVAAVEALYRHCHLRPPLIVTPESAVDFARAVATVARVRETGAFVAAALLALPCVPLVLAAVELNKWSRDEATLRDVDLGLVVYTGVMAVALTGWFLARLAWPRRSLLAVVVGYALGAVGGALTATLFGGQWRIAVVGATMGGALTALLQVLAALSLPIRRRIALRVRSGVTVAVRGSRPIHDVVRSRLDVAARNTPETPSARRERDARPPFHREERPQVAARLEAEGHRLTDYRWHHLRPLLGSGASSSGRLSLERVARRVADPDDLPAVLQAAIALDAAVDAVTLLEDVAVVLPSGSPIEAAAPRHRFLGLRLRSAHPPYCDVVAVLGDGFFLCRLIDLAWSEGLADHLLARHVARVEDSVLRQALIQAMGVGRFIGAAQIAPVHTDRTGALYLIGPDRDPLAYVRVEDASPKPHGSRPEHWLCVPPHVATAREAVAWTFGLPEHTYSPSAET